MGYQPLKQFHFELVGLNTVTGSLSVSSDSLENAEELLRQLNLLDLTKYVKLPTPTFVVPPKFL